MGLASSNGQRQLIAIARAALANAPVLILDEATSSIDSRTEKMVQEGMDRLMEGRTVFVIAHRLSTIVNSDVIMVMDHGRIIERGNHASLMAERGTYYRLYTGGLEIVLIIKKLGGGTGGGGSFLVPGAQKRIVSGFCLFLK